MQLLTSSIASSLFGVQKRGLGQLAFFAIGC